MYLKLLFCPFLTLFSLGQTNLLDSIAKEKILTESVNPINSILIYIERLDDDEILNKGYGLGVWETEYYGTFIMDILDFMELTSDPVLKKE